MSLTKYSARDVAKDFGVQPKEIVGVLAQHGMSNVSPTKTLTDKELTVIFEHLTQHNQVASIESIYADVYHEKKPAAPAAKAQNSKPQQAAPAANEEPQA